jgi:hypothetical protein
MSEAVSFDKKDFQKGLGAYLLFKNDTAKPTGDLLKWVNYQNSCRKKSRDGKHTELTADRIEMLDQVQFPWKLSHDERWNQRFRQLSVFKEQHGHCKVPQGRGFGDWVHNQRKAMKQHLQGKRNGLNSERIEKLDSIGFEWNCNDWDAMFHQLGTFREEEGGCLVPRRHGNLGRWVSYQRERYWDRFNGRESSITDNAIRQLESIGFQWKDEVVNASRS